MEPVPSARLEQGYAAQVLVYDDETYLMQDVAEEQEVESETVETGRFILIFFTYAIFVLLEVPEECDFVFTHRVRSRPGFTSLPSKLSFFVASVVTGLGLGR